MSLAPSAYDECLENKMPCLSQHLGQVWMLGQDKGMMTWLEQESGLSGRLLEGAPLALNEFMFYHKASGTLIASDSFYGGYSPQECPSWFARLWFKLTRDGSFRRCRLPMYRLGYSWIS